MSVVVVTPPAPIVSLSLAKKQCRIDVDNSDEDDLIAAYVAAASAAIDGPAGWLGRAIMPQTLEQRLDGFYAGDWLCGGGGGLAGYAWDGGWTDWSRWPFASRIELPFPPLIDIVSITYEDSTGADQVLSSGGWNAAAGDDDLVEPVWGSVWPAGRWDVNAVRVRYRAGYAAPGALPAAPALPDGAAPAPIQAAVLMAVASLYANRDAIVIDARAVVATNPAVDNLLGPYKVWRI